MRKSLLERSERVKANGKFSEWLYETLKSNGCTQHDLASELDIKRQNVSHWISGYHKPTKIHILAICKVFGIDDHETPWQYVKEQFGE